MTTVQDVAAVGKEIEKIVKQLTQGEKSVKNTVKSAKTLTSGSANGNPSASFGGLSDQTKQVLDKYSAMGGGGGGGGMMATSLGVVSAGIGAMWNSVPGVDDAYKYKQDIFRTAFNTPGRFNADRAFGRIQAGFGAGMDATGVESVSNMTNAGIGPASTRFNMTMNQSGMLSSFSGRSNASTSAGMVALQKGSTGTAGNLAKYGIFVTDPHSGKSGGVSSIVDQLWNRWYGSSTSKVDPVQFEADLMGGAVGSDLQYFFGSQPDLYQNVLDTLRLKMKAGGKHVNMNVNKKGPKSAWNAINGTGVTTEDMPWGTRQSIEQGRQNNIADSSTALIQGFQDAAVAINKFNEIMNGFINSAAGQLAMRGKGGADTIMGSQELGGLGNFLGGAGLMGLSSILRGGMGGGLGGGPKGSPGGMRIPGLGKIPLGGALARGGMLGGTAMAGGIGALGTMATMNGVDWLDDRNFSWAPDGGAVDRLGRFAGFMGGGAATGAGMGGPIGAILGTIGGAGYGIYDAITNPNGDSSAYMGGMFGSGSGGAPTFGRGRGADGGLPNSASEAISWAGASVSMTGKYDNACDGYVADAYGLANSNYEDARAHWNAVPARLKHPGDRNPPTGALVFWDIGNSGHVALVVGRGKEGPIVSTTHVRGTPTQMSLEECTRQLGGWGVYYGWSAPWFHGNSEDVGGATDPATAAADKAGKDPSTSSYSPSQVKSSSTLGVTNVMSSGLNVGGILGGGFVPSTGPGGSTNSTSVGGGTDSAETTGVSPTATPKINITGGQKALVGILQQAGFRGENLKEAWAIAMRESSGRSNAHNPVPPDDSYGLFQINMLGSLEAERNAKFRQYVPGYKDKLSLFDPLINAKAAAYMSQKGNNWASWVSPTYGRAKDYLAQFPGASAGMYLSRDQVVNAHAGEMIVPAAQTTQLREMLQGGIDSLKKSSNITIHVHVKNASREEATRLAKWVKEDLQNDSIVDRMRSQ